ncbi:MAG: prolipoprotein diacylglyceryl transferase [Moraxellaceae bacterium]|nr:prolipoprotein diacylglyceryl transferase [Pseudobdellovibrionaceae bacterium]
MKPFIDIGFIHLPTFYLVMSLALLTVLSFLSSRIKKNKNFERKTAFDLALVIMIFGFIGGRLFHVVYEEPSYYIRFPLQIFQFWNGGYVYFGGMLSALIASRVFLNRKGEKFLRWADFMAPVLSLIYALGRLACLFEGCCYGKACDLPWSINGLHPTQLYMVIAELVVFNIIIKLKMRLEGQIFFTWLMLHSASRFAIEFYRNDDRGFMLGNFISISQIISILLIGMSLFFLKANRSKI